jgi:hypothetical protein
MRLRSVRPQNVRPLPGDDGTQLWKNGEVEATALSHDVDRETLYTKRADERGVAGAANEGKHRDIQRPPPFPALARISSKRQYRFNLTRDDRVVEQDENPNGAAVVYDVGRAAGKCGSIGNRDVLPLLLATIDRNARAILTPHVWCPA